jgi:uncharacterized membrane protein YesL
MEGDCESREQPHRRTNDLYDQYKRRAWNEYKLNYKKNRTLGAVFVVALLRII